MKSGKFHKWNANIIIEPKNLEPVNDYLFIHYLIKKFYKEEYESSSKYSIIKNLNKYCYKLNEDYDGGNYYLVTNNMSAYALFNEDVQYVVYIHDDEYSDLYNEYLKSISNKNVLFNGASRHLTSKELFKNMINKMNDEPLHALIQADSLYEVEEYIKDSFDMIKYNLNDAYQDNGYLLTVYPKYYKGDEIKLNKKEYQSIFNIKPSIQDKISLLTSDFKFDEQLNKVIVYCKHGNKIEITSKDKLEFKFN